MARLLVTGASDYIGKHLTAMARAQGHTLVAPGRNAAPGAEFFPWSLGDVMPQAALAGVDAVIHLAHSWRADAQCDAAAPGPGLLRIAYMLEGGHSSAYLTKVPRDRARRQRDAWGVQLAERLRNMGLGNPYLWEALGLIPALLALCLSVMLSLRINRPSEVAR